MVPLVVAQKANPSCLKMATNKRDFHKLKVLLLMEKSKPIVSINPAQQTIIKSILSLIPLLGGPMIQLFSHRIAAQKTSRLERFMEDTELELTKLRNSRIDSAIIESDEFTDLLSKCIEMSLKTQNDQKAKLFASILGKSLTFKDFSFDEFEEIRFIFEQISFREFQLLQNLKDWTNKLNSDYLGMLKYANERTMINGCNAPRFHSFQDAFDLKQISEFGIEKDRLKTLYELLQQKGLLRKSTTDFSANQAVLSYRWSFGYIMLVEPTELFEQLSKFVTKED